MGSEEKQKAKTLLEALGCSISIDSDVLDELIQTHPTIKSFIAGDVSFAEAIFVEEYLANGFDVAKAVGVAQYHCLSRGQAYRMGQNLLRKKAIKVLLAKAVAQHAMEGEEVLARWGEVARANMEDFVSIQTVAADDGYERRVVALDLEKAIRENKMHLLKEVKFNADGSILVKLRDQDHALDQIARHLNLFEKDNEINLPPELIALMRLAPDQRREKLSEYSGLAQSYREEQENNGGA